jgi:hypothetical protein
MLTRLRCPVGLSSNGRANLPCVFDLELDRIQPLVFFAAWRPSYKDTYLSHSFRRLLLSPSPSLKHLTQSLHLKNFTSTEPNMSTNFAIENLVAGTLEQVRQSQP